MGELGIATRRPRCLWVEFILGVLRAAVRFNWYPELTGSRAAAPARAQLRSQIARLARRAT